MQVHNEILYQYAYDRMAELGLEYEQYIPDLIGATLIIRQLTTRYTVRKYELSDLELSLLNAGRYPSKE